MSKEENRSLEKVYGKDVYDLAIKEINELANNSNFVIDDELMKLGISFMIIKAEEILEGKREHRKLSDLVRESFGEASIYKFNVIGNS